MFFKKGTVDPTNPQWGIISTANQNINNTKILKWLSGRYLESRGYSILKKKKKKNPKDIHFLSFFYPQHHVSLPKMPDIRVSTVQEVSSGHPVTILPKMSLGTSSVE